MMPEELQTWLEKHVDKIVAFMDYEPTIETDSELEMTLGFWFDNDAWNDRGDQFIHLGVDGTGGQFAVWQRPGVDDPTPVVFFGSEGGAGVLTQSPEDFALALAHAPGVNEYPDDDGPACLDAELNWILDDENDEEMVEEARTALAHYREAVKQHIGGVLDLESLTGDLDDLNEEFTSWIAARVG